jgi:hypothetical protein
MARQLYKDTHQGRYVTFCRDTYGHIRPHAPGCDYCRLCWPPRGRGRGESLSSPRRLAALLRARDAYRMYGGLPAPRWLRLRPFGPTLEQVARACGYKTKGGAWRAIHHYHDWMHQTERMQERIPTPEEAALQARIEEYLADLAEQEADRLAEKKRRRIEASQRKRAKTLQTKRMAIAADLARQRDAKTIPARGI